MSCRRWTEEEVDHVVALIKKYQQDDDLQYENLEEEFCPNCTEPEEVCTCAHPLFPGTEAGPPSILLNDLSDDDIPF